MRVRLFAAVLVGVVGCSGPSLPGGQARCSDADAKWVVELMQKVGREWDDAVSLVNNSSRIQLATPISQLQRIRRDVEAQQWPECAKDAKSLLVRAMNAHIDGFTEFMGNRSGYETTISRGGSLFREFQVELARITGGPTPVPPRPTVDMTAIVGAGETLATLAAVAAPTPQLPTSMPRPVPTSTPRPVPTSPPTLTATPTLSPLKALISRSGVGSGRSTPFTLPRGDYIISWEASKPAKALTCLFGGMLAPTRKNPIATLKNFGDTEFLSDNTLLRGSIRLEAVQEGEYEFSITGGCQWIVAITPAP